METQYDAFKFPTSIRAYRNGAIITHTIRLLRHEEELRMVEIFNIPNAIDRRTVDVKCGENRCVNVMIRPTISGLTGCKIIGKTATAIGGDSHITIEGEVIGISGSSIIVDETRGRHGTLMELRDVEYVRALEISASEKVRLNGMQSIVFPAISGSLVTVEYMTDHVTWTDDYVIDMRDVYDPLSSITIFTGKLTHRIWINNECGVDIRDASVMLMDGEEKIAPREYEMKRSMESMAAPSNSQDSEKQIGEMIMVHRENRISIPTRAAMSMNPVVDVEVKGSFTYFIDHNAGDKVLYEAEIANFDRYVSKSSPFAIRILNQTELADTKPEFVMVGINYPTKYHPPGSEKLTVHVGRATMLSIKSHIVEFTHAPNETTAIHRYILLNSGKHMHHIEYRVRHLNPTDTIYVWLDRDSTKNISRIDGSDYHYYPVSLQMNSYTVLTVMIKTKLEQMR